MGRGVPGRWQTQVGAHYREVINPIKGYRYAGFYPDASMQVRLLPRSHC